ncbi:Mismatch repair endonuclease pms2 [Actinomortierella ambigua]|nr:Mismatch repair endonuclease pms2 [Actinomortierella ambigua]
MSGRIHAIDRESVHRICSGQVVLDLATAVKELVENSLDAGATFVEIKFKQQGLESLSVSDNGSGISDENLEALALKHYTSKLNDFSDLATVESFGFRGEALSSLCALARLSVTTSTGKSPMGVKVDYTADGIPGPKTPVPFPKGTCVSLTNLFEGMPVRRSEFVKNAKREFAKCLGLIQAYALISTNVRIKCTSLTDKKSTLTHLATTGNANIRQNIVNIFGAKGVTDIVELNLTLAEPSTDPDTGEKNRGIYIKGYISSPDFGKGRSSSDRQYFFLNGRPCMLPKIARVINEVYHSFNTNQYPFLVANLEMPTNSYDVNVSPDKRTIFLHNERVVVEELREKLTEMFEPSRSTFAVREAMIKKPDLSAFKRTVNGVSKEQEEASSEDEGEPLARKRPPSLVSSRGGGGGSDDRRSSIVEAVVGRTADIKVTERRRAMDEQQQEQDPMNSSAHQDSAEYPVVPSSSSSSAKNYVIQEITLESIPSSSKTREQKQTDLFKHFAAVSSKDKSTVSVKRPREDEDVEEPANDPSTEILETSILTATTSTAALETSATVPVVVHDNMRRIPTNDDDEDGDGKEPASSTTLNTTILDTRADDRADGIADIGVEPSESEDSDDDDVGGIGLASKTPRDRRVHRVVVLDSEVHQDGSHREWIEIPFDAAEQLQKRRLRMRRLQERRQAWEEEQESRARAQRQHRLRLAKLKNAAEEEEEEEEARLASIERQAGMEDGDGGSETNDRMEEDTAGDSDSVEASRKSRRLQQAQAKAKAKAKKDARQILSDASFANTDDTKARLSLSRIITKKDFAQMQILGQFNKAFIIARLDSTEEVVEEDGDEDEDGNVVEGTATATECGTKKVKTTRRTRSDIFVIDQHASDEKYNFETLQAKTAMSTQRLFKPKALYLTAQEELTVLDNMEVLNRNGFYLEHDDEAPVSHRLKLLTLPVSERVFFDQSDFEELVFLLSQQEYSPLPTNNKQEGEGEKEEDNANGTNRIASSSSSSSTSCSSSHAHRRPPAMVRPSKVRNLFASRACRRSVMIGDVLKLSQMKKIVRHMGEIDQPWNCPHGRPTMRHLLDLSELEQHQSQARSSTFMGGGHDGNHTTGSSTIAEPGTGLWDPISIKRPTRHGGSLFRQFMATPVTESKSL